MIRWLAVHQIGPEIIPEITCLAGHRHNLHIYVSILDRGLIEGKIQEISAAL
ncbi:hypothetical protein PE067_08680 [Paracoccus sp. DMF-8]|uniref:hypothetical protein n=1 Tax=Paracoccus sp. DMF-8 TaxID=3019445 RepID=UPI0023E7D870|nr:hypothetical protein [Paracoccus sp. DMF-8]MDF3606199.1 hypothetical protein [Paracoccus sp. DMF-8]